MIHPVWSVFNELVFEQAAVPGCLCILLNEVVLGWVLKVQRVTDALRSHNVTHKQTASSYRCQARRS